MAKVAHDKFMKDAVFRVKELCGDVDDNSVQILLQQYDFNVEHTVQAFLDGSADESLREWKSTAGGMKTGASKKKKKNRNKNSAKNQEKSNNSQLVTNTTPEVSALCNGGIASNTHLNGTHLYEASTNVEEQQDIRVPVPEQPQQKLNVQTSRPKEDYKQQTKKARDRTLSEASSSSGINKPSKNPHAGLEKSCKDLQRQAVSLQRLKVVLNEQLDKSYKRISEVFKELHNQLNEREALLIFEMDRVKNQANEVLEDQQHRAAELKLQTDRAQAMKESGVAELRSKIKFFVSERKHYEDLSHSQRFVCDFNHFLEELKKFGEVVSVKSSPDNRRASVASLGSNISQEEVPIQSKPSSAISITTAPRSASPAPTSPTSSSSQSCTAAAPPAAAAAAPAAAAAAPAAATAAPAPVYVPNSTHVLMQSESLTKYEATEMAQRLINLTLNESPDSSASSTVRSSRSERSWSSRGRGAGSSVANVDRGGKPNSGDQQRDTQSSRGQGQSRGGRGQGRSNRGQGQSRGDRGQGQSRPSTNESSANDKSNKARDTHDPVPEDNEVNNPVSPRNPSVNPTLVPKSSGSSPRRGARQGGRQENGGRSSGNSPVKSQVNAKPSEEPQTKQAAPEKSALESNGILPSSNSKASSGGLTNGQVDALPQRGIRPNRRNHGTTRQEAENHQTTAVEPILANED